MKMDRPIDRLDRLLHENHMRRADLARLLKMTDQAIGMWWQRGVVPPSRYVKLGALLGVSAEYIETGNTTDGKTYPAPPTRSAWEKLSPNARAFIGDLIERAALGEIPDQSIDVLKTITSLQMNQPQVKSQPINRGDWLVGGEASPSSTKTEAKKHGEKGQQQTVAHHYL